VSILIQKQEFWEAKIAPVIPKKLTKLFTFGYETLVGVEITSMRANARLAPLAWSTAKSKIWRLATNVRIVSVFTRLLTVLALVTDDDVVAIDFSDFKDGRQVLMFAKQTRKGRALPLYFEILEYPIEKDSQNLFVNAAIARFISIVGCRPCFVFDRGFACPSIIKYMAQQGLCFLIRIKKRKRFHQGQQYAAAEDLGVNDIRIEGYARSLRLVVSDDPKNGNDPWYLITNDLAASREEIIKRYYHRFEIEEFFRDAKRLLGLEYVRFHSAQSCAVALWFVMLTMWLFEQIAEGFTEADDVLRARWRVSRCRYIIEKLRRESLWALVAAAGPPI
jgi:hypothetical protein